MPLNFGLGEQLLLFLAIGIGILMLFALGFAGSVVLLRLHHQRRAEKWSVLEAKWEDAILEMLAEDRDPSTVHALVAEGDELFCVSYIMRYASRLSGPERERLQELARPYLPLVVPRAQHRDARRRARAVRTLGTLGLPEYGDIVAAALGDDSPLVSMVAARALARGKDPDYVIPVLDHLDRFTAWSPNFLASMLASIGPGATPALRVVFADAKRPPEVRAVAATALGYLNDLAGGDIAVQVLALASDRELLAAALRLIGRVGHRDHRSAVLPFLTASDFYVRATAASALGGVGDKEDLELLRIACEDDSRWVAIHAARALRDAGDINSLQQLAASGGPRATLALQVLSEVGG
jgi:hypothetical protein